LEKQSSQNIKNTGPTVVLGGTALLCQIHNQNTLWISFFFFSFWVQTHNLGLGEKKGSDRKWRNYWSLETHGAAIPILYGTFGNL